MKVCKKCQVEKQESDFPITGKGYRRNVCKVCIKEYQKNYRSIANKSRRKRRKTDLIFAEKDREHSRQFRKKNPEYMRDYHQEWCKKNKLNNNLRRRFKRGLKSHSPKLEKLVGCKIEQFKEHISKQFDSSMSWDNYGSHWTIDHIFPVSKATNEQEGIAIFHYLNCRPLTIQENSAKNGRLKKQLLQDLLKKDIPYLLRNLIESSLPE